MSKIVIEDFSGTIIHPSLRSKQQQPNANMNETNPVTASVKVMRSYDYCHFEVALSTSGVASIEEVDNLRKTAARLADKAVEQYKVAKENLEMQESHDRSASYIREEAIAIEAKPETERTPEEQATLKAYNDHVFHANRRYNYEDDWQDDCQEDDE
jgi:hypothetical protein